MTMPDVARGQTAEAERKRFYVRARTVPAPVVPLSRLPLSPILGHLARTRRALKGSAQRRREAGGDGFLREWEARLVAELDDRQLRIE